MTGNRTEGVTHCARPMHCGPVSATTDVRPNDLILTQLSIIVVYISSFLGTILYTTP